MDCMAGLFTGNRSPLVTNVYDLERTCEMEFQRWCAEELVDPRLRDVLEEAFEAGFQIGLHIGRELEHERLSPQSPPDASPAGGAGDPAARRDDADDRRSGGAARRVFDRIPPLAEAEGEKEHVGSGSPVRAVASDPVADSPT